MARTTGPSDTQKIILISLNNGWRLRRVQKHGWCLFQEGWERPFGQAKVRTVDEMTKAGWLTPTETVGLGCQPAKELTVTGREQAERLINENWGRSDEWSPNFVGTTMDPNETGEFRIAA